MIQFCILMGYWAYLKPNFRHKEAKEAFRYLDPQMCCS